MSASNRRRMSRTTRAASGRSISYALVALVAVISMVFAGLVLPSSASALTPTEGTITEPVTPVVDEPVVDEPVVDEPVVDEPVVDEPVVDEPVVDEPAADGSDSEPVLLAPDQTDPCATDPESADAATQTTDASCADAPAAEAAADATLDTDKPSYYAGGRVGVSGTGFEADETVTITASTSDGAEMFSGSATADADGAFEATFKLGRDAAGDATVAADGGASGRSASADFNVVPLGDPTIESDKDNYPAGADVTLTGTSWEGDETVTITVKDTVADSVVHVAEVAVSTNGRVKDIFTLPDYFVTDYDVTAEGAQTGRIATTTFKDPDPAPTIKTGGDGYSQCANDKGAGYVNGVPGECSWINGNLQKNNSAYNEGDATVQRVWLTGMSPGSQHSITLKYGTTKGGKHAYDYLTKWSWSEDWAGPSICPDGLAGCQTPSNTGTVAAGEVRAIVPKDMNQSNNYLPPFNNPGGTADDYISMQGGVFPANPIVGPTVVSGDPMGPGDSETVITVSFQVPQTGGFCDAGVCDVLIYFGAHVASQAAWGTGNGAGSIEGSPYHVAIDATDGLSVGQRDNQMQAAAIVPNGSVTIIKDTQPNAADDFKFALGNGTTIAVPDFYLDDDSDVVLPDRRTFSVPAGRYTADELTANQGSYTLDDIVCTSGNPAYDESAGTAIFDVTSGETVTCTITNTLNTGSLVLAKALTGWPAGTTYTGPFTIHYDCGVGFIGDATVSAGSSVTAASGIPTGTSCTVTEPTLPTNQPTGYRFGTPTFSHTVGDVTSPGGTVVIPDTNAVSVTVTTNNTLLRNTGSLVLAKALTGVPAGTAYTGPFTIHYDCGVGFIGDATVSAGSSVTAASGIPTGTSCTVTEPTLPTNQPTGYRFGTPTFSHTVGDVTSPGGTVVIPDTNAVSVTVTTNNTLLRNTGSLVLAKALTGVPAGTTYTGPFTIHYDCGVGFIGDATVSAGSSGGVGYPDGDELHGDGADAADEPAHGLPVRHADVLSHGRGRTSPGGTVVIPDTNAVSVTVTTNNTLPRNTGSLVLAKALTGVPAGRRTRVRSRSITTAVSASSAMPRCRRGRRSRRRRVSRRGRAAR